MEKFQELREISKKKIILADHILTQTYPLLKDPKLLISAIENVFLAYTNSISSLLYYERLFKKIPNFQDNFDSKFRMFVEACSLRHKIKQEDINSIRDIKNIIIEHRKSPMEFAKEDRFIICSKDYNIKTIKFEDIKEMIIEAKKFISKVDEITCKHEKIFR